MSELAADDPRHGTSVGYTYHRCRCDACRTFQREYLRSYRKRNPTKYREGKNADNASYRALWRLADMHRSDFERLRDEERAKVGLPAGRRNVA